MSTHIDGDTPCPNDEAYEHAWYFGCVPKTFNGNTGRCSDGVKQAVVALPANGERLRYMWPGGCDLVAKLTGSPNTEATATTKETRT